jgi:hypothetical protein
MTCVRAMPALAVIAVLWPAGPTTERRDRQHMQLSTRGLIVCCVILAFVGLVGSSTLPKDMQWTMGAACVLLAFTCLGLWARGR